MAPAARPQVREALLAAARAELVEHGRAAISLRAVARRAGLSHASPKYHFGDRSGLLTAIATEGFHTLARHLSQVHESDAQQQLAALGRAYIDFGLSHRALFELMFAPGELHATDPELIAAQQQAIGALTTAVSRLAGVDATPSGTPKLALISWALVHGLVVLARDGALQAAATPPATNVAELAHTLTDLFTQYVGDDLAGVNTNLLPTRHGHHPSPPTHPRQGLLPAQAIPGQKSQRSTAVSETAPLRPGISTADP